jgi:ketosteroid isomerase-like protein
MGNIAIVREVYDAFERQDLEGLLALVDPDCVVTQDASLPWGAATSVTTVSPPLPSRRCSKPMIK